MIIRELTKDDFPCFKYLITQFRKTEFEHNEFRETLDKITKTSEIWIIEIDGKLLVSGTLIIENKFIHNLCKLGHIEDVIVDETQRGKGLGKIIIQKLLERSEDLGCYKTTLDCSITNTEFYEKCGMEKRGTQMSYLFHHV